MKEQKERGFTFVELLITFFILTLVLLSISSMVYSVMSSTEESKETSTATTLTQDRMEALKNTKIILLTSGNDSVLVGNINYLRQWFVSYAANVRTITVTVSWTSQGSHSVTMTTLRGD